MVWTPELGCPGCSGKLIPDGMRGVFDCSGCGGVIAHGITKALSESLVIPKFHPNPSRGLEARSVYYDIFYVKPDGTNDRRHGWFEPLTRLILQTG